MQDYIAGATERPLTKSRSVATGDIDTISIRSQKAPSPCFFVDISDDLRQSSPDLPAFSHQESVEKESDYCKNSLEGGLRYSNSAPCVLHTLPAAMSPRAAMIVMGSSSKRSLEDRTSCSRDSSLSGNTCSPLSYYGLAALEKPLLAHDDGRPREADCANHPFDRRRSGTALHLNCVAGADPPYLRNWTPKPLSQRWVERVAQKKYRKFTVQEISEGKCKRIEMQTPELLRAVHFHNKSNLLEDTAVGALKLRDLRQVVSPLGVDRPSIEARRNCILVNLLSLRCIIQHNRVFFIHPGYGAFQPGVFIDPVPLEDNDMLTTRSGMSFDPDSISNENMMLIDKIAHLTDLRNTGPFEFAALEAVLVEVCQRLSNELGRVKKAADKLLFIIREEPGSSRKLREVTDLRRSLDSLTDKASGVHTALRELLDTEDDIRRLNITRFWHHPEQWQDPGNSAAAEDVEILLECYEQEVESMLKAINRTDAALDDALQMVELHLASVRNTFLKSELGLDIVGVIVGLIAAVAGLFGMNIKTGLEDDQSLFWTLTLSLLLVCVLTSIITFIVFKRMKL